jgi:hypothetical protein
LTFNKIRLVRSLLIPFDEALVGFQIINLESTSPRSNGVELLPYFLIFLMFASSSLLLLKVPVTAMQQTLKV